MGSIAMSTAKGSGGTGIASVEHIAGFAFQPLVVHMIEPIFMCCDGGAFFVQPSQVKACDSIIVANCGRLLDMPSTNAESPLLARGFAGFCPEASRIAEHHDREQRLGSHGFRRILPSPVKVRVMIVDQMFEANPVSSQSFTLKSMPDDPLLLPVRYAVRLPAL